MDSAFFNQSLHVVQHDIRNILQYFVFFLINFFIKLSSFDNLIKHDSYCDYMIQEVDSGLLGSY